MTVVLLILGLALVGASARLVVRAALVPRLRLKSHLREIGEYGFETNYEDVDIPLAQRLRRGLSPRSRP
jgi:hypothetical protein